MRPFTASRTGRRATRSSRPGSSGASGPAPPIRRSASAARRQRCSSPAENVALGHALPAGSAFALEAASRCRLALRPVAAWTRWAFHLLSSRSGWRTSSARHCGQVARSYRASSRPIVYFPRSRTRSPQLGHVRSAAIPTPVRRECTRRGPPRPERPQRRCDSCFDAARLAIGS